VRGIAIMGRRERGGLVKVPPFVVGYVVEEAIGVMTGKIEGLLLFGYYSRSRGLTLLVLKDKEKDSIREIIGGDENKEHGWHRDQASKTSLGLSDRHVSCSVFLLVGEEKVLLMVSSLSAGWKMLSRHGLKSGSDRRQEAGGLSGRTTPVRSKEVMAMK
jgi:hypothetical protein